LLVGHHPELDLDVAHAVDPGHCGRDVSRELGLHWAAGHGEQHTHMHRPGIRDGHGRDHAKLGDRLMDLRIKDRL
jgi:hypothetical protein